MRAVLLVMMMARAAAWAGDDLEPLDDAFLEYLATMEEDGDDWTLLDETERSAPVATGNDAAAGHDKAVSKSTATRMPGKEAAQPAVEKR